MTISRALARPLSRPLKRNLYSSAAAAFTPTALFANGEQGAWYDPSDLTTLYQDSAGTTPVTAAGQVVGRIEDKSGNGNHATQTTTASKPILGRNPVGGRRNLLTYTEQFDDVSWGKTTIGVTANSGVSPFGETTADTLTPTAVVGDHKILMGVAAPATHIFSVYAKASGYDWVILQVAGGYAWFNVSTGTVGTTSSVTATIEAADNGFFRCSILETVTTTSSAYLWVANGNGTTSFTADGTSGVIFYGAQLETGSTATAYQKVVTQYDVTEAGKTDHYYLTFDGVDDSLVTGNLDFSASDEMSVFAGVRKLSDAAIGIVAELGIGAANGSFNLSAPRNGSTANFGFSSKGTADVGDAISPSSYSAPLTKVLTGLGDISGTVKKLRLNGVEVASETGNQGTGNYGNQALFIGRRAGTSLSLNGRIYSLITRGKLTAGADLTSTEAYVAGKTGVTL